MQKIGIYGGSFNPIHMGHINLMRSYMKELSLDKVIIIPTNVPPHKQTDELACAQDRLKMVEIVSEELGGGFFADDIEIRRMGKSYTVDTLKELKKQYPASILYLIMGSDMFLTLHQWHKADEILQLAVICTACREHSCEEKMQIQKRFLQTKGARVIFCSNIEVLPMSSTEIRQDVRRGKNISKKVLPKVAKYIAEKRLYI